MTCGETLGIKMRRGGKGGAESERNCVALRSGQPAALSSRRGVLWQLARGGGRRAAGRIASANASYLCKVSHFWRRGKVQANWGVILASFMMGADGGVSKHFVVGRLGDSDVAHYGPIQ
jgi:hypothetical protein